MQLSRNFSRLALFVLALASAGKATPLTDHGDNEIVTISTVSAEEPAMPYIVSHEEMLHWLTTTDAELTFIGKPLNPLAQRTPQSTIVTYCTNRVERICGGKCSVYNGPAQCIDATGTECLKATKNVAFCDGSDCGGTCHELSNCADRLNGGFCSTPSTVSILVSA